MASISMQNVCKRYGGTSVIEDLALDVHDKEFLVLVGPSGCGKSTLLRMIAGLEDISSGSIAMNGKRVNDVSARDRDVAMVFQNYALYPHMTVAENMGLALRLRKVPKAEIARKVNGAAEILGIQPLLARKPRQLSGGQRQRVAMGRAIVRDPKAFLFDEPLSNLDAELRLKMRTEIKLLHGRLRSTMVYVTHDQVEAMTLADRIVVMKGGVIQQIGSPIEVFRRPANVFVAGFIGSPPMNFLSAQLLPPQPGGVNGPTVLLSEIGVSFPFPLDTHAVPKNGDPRHPLPLILGIRPQQLSPAQERHPIPIEAEVSVIEPLGTEMLVIVNCGTGPEGRERRQLTYKCTYSETVRVGDRIRLGCAGENVHLFDGASGSSLRI